jgi:DNA-binding MarR family transcriptional regulator
LNLSIQATNLLSEPDQLFQAARSLQRSRVGALLYRAQQLVSGLLAPAMNEANLTLGQIEVLAGACAAPFQDQITLAKYLGIDRSSITSLVDMLESKSLIERSAHQDRRRRLLTASDLGRAALEHILPYRDAVAAQVMAAASEGGGDFLTQLRHVGENPASNATPWLRPTNPQAIAHPEYLNAVYRHPSFLIRRAFQVAMAMFTEDAQAYAVNTMHYRILTLLAKNYVSDQSELIRVTDVNKSVMILSLNLLEKRGFLHRAAFEGDRRRKILSLTDDGQQLAAALNACVARYEQRFFQPLRADEQQTMMENLRCLADNLAS